METKKDTGSVLKQALERRQTGSLSSNFSFRMMAQIRHEAICQQKRKERRGFIFLLAVVALLVGGVATYLFYKMNVEALELTMPSLDYPQASSSVVGFYCYIAVLGFILLGLDYWLRKKNRERKSPC